jgi:hypothetical protein
MKLHYLVALTLLALIVSAKPATAENPAHIYQLLETNLCVGCDLKDANQRQAHVIGADSRNVVLQDAVAEGASLEGVNFIATNLRGADLTESSRINYVAQSIGSESQDQSEKVYFNRQKVNFLEQLKQENKQLPTGVLGMPESDFKQASGKVGYVQTGLWLNLKEIFPIPKVGTIANRTGSQTLIFNFMGLVDRSGTVMMADPLPVSSGYRITAYRLVTGFLDSSQQFYQLYYQVKYQELQH